MLSDEELHGIHQYYISMMVDGETVSASELIAQKYQLTRYLGRMLSHHDEEAQEIARLKKENGTLRQGLKDAALTFEALPSYMNSGSLPYEICSDAGVGARAILNEEGGK